MRSFYFFYPHMHSFITVRSTISFYFYTTLYLFLHSTLYSLPTLFLDPFKYRFPPTTLGLVLRLLLLHVLVNHSPQTLLGMSAIWSRLVITPVLPLITHNTHLKSLHDTVHTPSVHNIHASQHPDLDSISTAAPGCLRDSGENEGDGVMDYPAEWCI